MSIPLKAKVFCTVKTAKIVSLIIIMVWVIFESQWFFIVKKVEEDGEAWCDYAYERMHSKYPKFYTLFDSTVYSFLPFIFIIIFNAIIIARLLMTRLRSADSGQKSALSKKAVSTAVLLLGVSVSFMVLTAPASVAMIIDDVMGHTISDGWWVLVIFCYYINHSSNALLYCFLGPKFRKEVLKLFCKGRYEIESSVDHSSSFTGNKVGPSHTQDTEC